jgi:Uncharacterized protein conserved in bacteria
MDEKLGLAILRQVFPDTTGLAIERWCEEPEQAVDANFTAGGQQFAVEFKAAATSEDIGAAIRQAGAWPTDKVVPLIVVPYMGDAGRQLCRAAGISWLDLSGNADIDRPPIRIRILCEPNRYKRPGRPEALFAPRSARLARVLLLHHNRTWPQAELTRATGLSSGFLSRLLPRYVESGYLEREEKGRTYQYKLIEPARLLDAWHAEYDFSRHTIVRGHIASRNGPELLHDLGHKLGMQNVEYAATGLASAWLYEPHASFRTVTLYLATMPGIDLQTKLGFHRGSRGSNTWLTVPDDDGVFAGASERDGIRCVSPLQTYLDLKAQPERAEEAAGELRRTKLAWQT